jgi:hypothetical protein
MIGPRGLSSMGGVAKEYKTKLGWGKKNPSGHLQGGEQRPKDGMTSGKIPTFHRALV